MLCNVISVLWITSCLDVMDGVALRGRPERLAGLAVSYVRSLTSTNVCCTCTQFASFDGS